MNMRKYAMEALGKAPGTLLHIGKQKCKRTSIDIIDYNQANITITQNTDIDRIFEAQSSTSIRWINITGLHNTSLIEKIGNHFKIHPISLENITNTMQRGTFDEFEDYIHIITKLVYWNSSYTSMEIDQVSLIIGKNYIITFMEQDGDFLDPIINRLKNDQSKSRKFNSDYLAYSIMDLIVDNYFIVIDKLENKIEMLEKKLVLQPTPVILQQIQQLKRNLVFLRKSILPCRELVSAMQNSDSKLLPSEIDIYVKNLYEHIIQVIDITETLRDIVSGMLDIYLSSVSNEMSKVMKVLTIIATIFIPITFITGLYGMNFNTNSKFNMPELGWHYGYFFALGLMALVVVIMLLFFKRKKWL